MPKSVCKHMTIDNQGTTRLHPFHWSTKSVFIIIDQLATDDWCGLWCTLTGVFGECCSGRLILFQVKDVLMEAKLTEYRTRKRREAAKQFLYNMVTLNSQQHVDGNERNVPVPSPQEVNVLSSHFSYEALNAWKILFVLTTYLYIK
jgi:hypothetical protein